MHSVKAEKQGEAARHRPDADGNPEAEGLADSAQAKHACNSQGEGDQRSPTSNTHWPKHTC